MKLKTKKSLLVRNENNESCIATQDQIIEVGVHLDENKAIHLLAMDHVAVVSDKEENSPLEAYKAAAPERQGSEAEVIGEAIAKAIVDGNRKAAEEALKEAEAQDAVDEAASKALEEGDDEPAEEEAKEPELA